MSSGKFGRFVAGNLGRLLVQPTHNGKDIMYWFWIFKIEPDFDELSSLGVNIWWRTSQITMIWQKSFMDGHWHPIKRNFAIIKPIFMVHFSTSRWDPGKLSSFRFYSNMRHKIYAAYRRDGRNVPAGNVGIISNNFPDNFFHVTRSWCRQPNSQPTNQVAHVLVRSHIESNMRRAAELVGFK